MSEKIFVTGASGFLGKHFCQEASSRFTIFPLARSDSSPEIYKNIPGNPEILGLDDFLEGGLAGEALVHFAGRVHQMRDVSSDPLAEFRKANTELPLALAKAALQSGLKKFIFISTVKVMGEKPGFYPLDARPAPCDPYGLSKWEAEQNLQKLFLKQNRTRCIIFRLPMVYGPGNKGNMLALLNAASRGIPLPLKSAKGRRSMVYVKNVGDAIMKVLLDMTPHRPPVQTYFLHDGVAWNSGELYSRVCQSFSGRTRIFSVPKQFMHFAGVAGSLLERWTGKKFPLNNEIISRLFDEYRFSAKEFIRDYKWQPQYAPEEGIRETVEWYKEVRRSGLEKE